VLDVGQVVGDLLDVRQKYPPGFDPAKAPRPQRGFCVHGLIVVSVPRIRRRITLRHLRRCTDLRLSVKQRGAGGFFIDLTL
jgi:hypothetical protein